MKRPLVGLAFLYAAGIALGAWVTGPLVWWWVGATSLFVAFFFWRRLPLLFLAVFVTGILMCRSFQTESSPRHVLNLLGQTPQPVGLRGVVRCDTAGRRSFDLEVEAVRTGTVWQVAEGRVFVFVRAKAPTEAHQVQYGDRIEFSADLRVPSAPRNPGALDWARWLKRQRIYHTAAINESDTYERLERDRGNALWALSLRLRDRFQEALHLGLEDEPKLAGVLAGMVIGERAEIPPETYAAFQRTGVFHIFSVSGLNVTLVGVVVLGVLLGLRVPRRWSGLACIPALALFVLATGARPGAVRTLVMASVLLVGWALVRPVDLRNSLAAAALVILVLDPLQLFDGGFILSFGAVTALVVLTPPIEERLLSWIKLDPLRPAVLTTGWQRGSVGAAQMVARAVSGSLAAWVGLLPLMAVYFNLFSPVSVLANVVVIPVLGVITWLGMLAGAAFGWWNWLTLTLNNANFFFLAALIRCVEWLGRLPNGYWFVQAPPMWWVAGYYGWLALLLTYRRKWLVLGATPILGLALWWAAPQRDTTEIIAFDLSQGASAFVNLPGEKHDFLIDGGDDYGGDRILVPALRAQGVDRLAAVVLSCADKGHAAGLLKVAAKIPVAAAFDAGTRGRSPFYRQWQREMPGIRELKAGTNWPAAPGTLVRVLHPPVATASGRADDNVLVLMLETGGHRVLFMSDASDAVEDWLVASGQDLRADVVIREGSGREALCSQEFLAAVHPRWVILQTHSWPHHRQPQPAFTARLAAHGVRLIRTAEAGAVTVRLGPAGITVLSFLPVAESELESDDAVGDTARP